MRSTATVSAGLAVALLFVAACGGQGAGSPVAGTGAASPSTTSSGGDAGPTAAAEASAFAVGSEVPPLAATEEPAAAAGQGDPGVVAQTVIMNFQGHSPFVAPGVIDSRGFEFTVSPNEASAQGLVAVSVELLNGEIRELAPSAELTGMAGPSPFWGLYATADPLGLLPAGDYVFRFTFDDGRVVEQHHRFDGRSVDIARNVQVERAGKQLRLRWDPVEGVRNYSVAIYESEGGTTLRDTGLGCDGGEGPAGADVSLREPHCTVTDAQDVLRPGQEYLIIVAAWGIDDFDATGNGKNASFSGNQAALITW